MKTNEQIIQEIESKAQKAAIEAEEEKKGYLFLNNLGLYGPNSIVYTSRLGFGFGYSKPLTLEEVRKIVELLPPDEEKTQVLSFSSRENIETASPFKIGVSNYEHRGDADIKLDYISKSGYRVQCTINESEYKELFRVERKQGGHLGFGRYETKRVFKFLQYGTINLFGDGQYLYCRSAEEKESFEFFILNGKQKEQ